MGLAEAELRALEGALSPGYQLGDLVATGGMATVYRAMPSLGGRHVAVKVMHPHLAATIAIERFHQEVEIIRATVHPRIVPLLETGHAGQLLYYLMPYVDGETLQARLDRDADDHDARYALATSLFLAGQIEAAMDHLLKIVRRDRSWNEDGARAQLLKFFEALGPKHPATLKGRRLLSSVLFS